MEQTQDVEILNDKEMLSKLSAQDRYKVVQGILQGLLEDNSTGITISQMQKLVPYDQTTIAKHLDYLTAIRIGYRVKFGNTYVYYPNGKIHHPTRIEEHQLGDRYYSVYLIKNPLGEYVYIQEKKKDRDSTTTVSGGLIVPKENIDEFFQIIKKTVVEADEHGSTTDN
jgi:hypothetical protein